MPRTEPSAPCCVAAAPELFIECRGQSVQRSRVGAAHSPPKGHRGPRGFWLSLPGSSTSVADQPLLRGFKAREQPSQSQVGKLSAAKLKKDHSIHSIAPHARRSTRNTDISPHVVSDPQYRRRSVCSVAVFAPPRPSLRVRTLRRHASFSRCRAEEVLARVVQEADRESRYGME